MCSSQEGHWKCVGVPSRQAEHVKSQSLSQNSAESQSTTTPDLEMVMIA